MALSGQLTYLQRVVMEMVDTERTYVSDLRMVVEEYLSTMIEQVCVRPELVCSLFGNIEDIYEFNSELLQDLDLCDMDPVGVARCFVMKVRLTDDWTPVRPQAGINLPLSSFRASTSPSTHSTAQTTPMNQTFNRLLSIDVDQRKAVCTEPPVTGPCRASFSRWFYNPLDQKCSPFTYGGCHGNKNNFEDEATCGDACSGITEEDVFSRGLFERFKDDESDSGSIALAVILAVAILALLAVCLYCFLMHRKKRSHRPVATGPAPMALSEQDTLVYNSTTKPV